MQELKPVKTTTYFDNQPNCIKSICTDGKKFYAFLPKWAGGSLYFEITNNLKEKILEDMDKSIIIYLKWDEGSLKIDQFGIYVSESFDLEYNDLNDAFSYDGNDSFK